MSRPVDPYRVLQVDPGADQEAIKTAYRRLARRFHPDHAPDDESTARMVLVNQAWEMIGTPEGRIRYDREHGIVGMAPSYTTVRAEEAPTRGGRDAARAGGSPDDGSARASAGASGAGGVSEPEGSGRQAGGPDGPVLEFGRYAGWSLGEIAKVDLDYLMWLQRTPIGRQYTHALDELIKRTTPAPAPRQRVGQRGILSRRRGFGL